MVPKRTETADKRMVGFGQTPVQSNPSDASSEFQREDDRADTRDIQSTPSTDE